MGKSRIGWGLVATVFAARASFAPMARAQQGKSDAEGRKRQVVELLKSIETGDPKPVAVINPKKYIQHSPGLGDGVEGFSRLVGMAATPNSPIKFDKIHKVLGEGDFVLVVCEGSFRGKPSAFYDLFRVEGGKVVEHWDAIEAIPPKSEWKNDNGKF